MKKILFIISFLIICLMIPLFANDKKEVKIAVEVANIRARPGLDGDIIGKARKGDVFKILSTDGNWYKISFTKENGKTAEGYIHKAIVKTVSSETKLTPQPPPSSSKKAVKKSVKKTEQKKVVRKKKTFKPEQEKLFSGFYLKGGIMTSPEVDSFSDEWILAFGFDKAIGKYMTWGLEFQPYYRSFSDDVSGLSIKSISANIFLNVKGGINIGQFVNSLKFLTIYGGLGIGTNLSNTSVTMGDAEGNQFDPFFSWHIFYGTEIELGKIKLIIEIQNNKIIVSDIDPSTQSFSFLLIGVRF